MSLSSPQSSLGPYAKFKYSGEDEKTNSLEPAHTNIVICHLSFNLAE